MSLAEETARVAGGGKNTLKTMLQKLGVGVGSERIDQYPTLANQISGKLHPDNLISAATASSLGLAGTATPNEAFAKIKALIDAANSNANAKCRIVTGSYVGTGTYGNDSPCSLNFGFVPKFIVILEYSTVKYDEANTFALFINPLPRTNRIAPSTTNYPYGALEVTWGTTVTWKISNNVPWRFTDYKSAAGQMNGAGYTYYYAAID